MPGAGVEAATTDRTLEYDLAGSLSAAASNNPAPGTPTTTAASP
ncbi:hypothetical protein OHA79_00210 [Streptomyces sp. NBC_00841]|nr:hypothetical protein [Streptomyces sp. NBC_00841]WRZ96538.1 hypothetical protein OHA79_00210 [Streptomyces sp. NBC_00841]